MISNSSILIDFEDSIENIFIRIHKKQRFRNFANVTFPGKQQLATFNNK